MDFIFDDDVDEVGSDIESYCPKCKSDTSHTVITKYEDEIRRVQCSPCGDVHPYRKPRTEAEDEIPEPIAAKKRATLKKPTWQEAMDRGGAKGRNHARPYSIRDSYAEGDAVLHPKFGIGFVTEISENKVEVTFEDERRVLVHNRPDLAAVMPAIAQVPAPRPAKHQKKSHSKKAKGTAQSAAAKPSAIASPSPLVPTAVQTIPARTPPAKPRDEHKAALSTTPQATQATATQATLKSAKKKVAGPVKKQGKRATPHPAPKAVVRPPTSAPHGQRRRNVKLGKKGKK